MRATLINRKDAAIRYAFVIPCLLILPACAQAPDVGGVANVAGVAWQSDTTPLANSPVVVECVGARVFDTTATDEAGHYTISLYSGFSGASPGCTCYAPSVQHPVAMGGQVIFFFPSDQPHPIQIIDLFPRPAS